MLIGCCEVRLGLLQQLHGFLLLHDGEDWWKVPLPAGSVGFGCWFCWWQEGCCRSATSPGRIRWGRTWPISLWHCRLQEVSRLVAHSTSDIVTDLDMLGFPPGKCFPWAATQCWRFADNRHVIALMTCLVMCSISAQNDAKRQAQFLWSWTAITKKTQQSLKRGVYTHSPAGLSALECSIVFFPSSTFNLSVLRQRWGKRSLLSLRAATMTNYPSLHLLLPQWLPGSSGPAFPAQHRARSHS